MRALAPVVLFRAACDVTDPRAVERAFEEHRPWAVINAAGSPDVDAAEYDFPLTDAIHFRAALNIANRCAAHGIALASFSSDAVFDICDEQPATESMPTHPVNTYGVVKAAADVAILQAHPQALVARTGLLIGFERRDPVEAMIRALKRGERVQVADDEAFSAAHVGEFANAVLDLLVDREQGLWHVTDGAKRSWAELITAIAPTCLSRRVVRVPGATLGRPATRPHYCVLGSERAILLNDLDHAVRRLERRARTRPAVA